MKSTEKRSSGKKPKGKAARSKRVLTERSRWSYFMQGYNPDDDDSATVELITKVFGPVHPMWVIGFDPTRKVTPEKFKALREQVLRLTQMQTARYLRVGQTTLSGWERGTSPIPFSAYETLRLLADHVLFRLWHDMWDGWFINQKTGELVSPDVGRLSVTPADINAIPHLHSIASTYKLEYERLKRELQEAIAENTRIRELYLSGGITDELREMQDHVTTLLARIGTAHIADFPVPANPQTEHRKAA